MDDPKGPAAVVLVLSKDRSDRVLALTRGQDFADWHLPGGKVEPDEGYAEAAARELHEETGLWVSSAILLPLCSIVSRSGRPVEAFMLEMSESIALVESAAGHPAWVTMAMLTMPSCSFSDECRKVMEAAGSAICSKHRSRRHDR